MENYLDFFELDRNKEELTASEIEYLDSLSLDEIDNICKQLNDKYNYHNALQTGLKLILNSTYGAFGNEFFVCSNKDIAGAITAMCRDLIKHMDNIHEEYWYEYWHLDYDLHEYLGITGEVKKIDDSWIHRESKTPYDGVVTQQEMEDGVYQRKVPVSHYVDTDSLFCGFDPGMKSCDWKGNEQEFISKIAKFRLEPLFKKYLKRYAKKHQVENIQDFELENINESVLFIGKKTYIKHTIWEDGRQYARLTNIVPKGVDLIKKGTPKFAREKVMEIIKYLFDNSSTYNIRDLLKFVRDLKKEFELTNINDITPTHNITSYWSSKIMVDNVIIDGPGIVKDKEELKFAKNTQWRIKAGALYNHLLYQHPELINDYDQIRIGTKVKIYPTTHELNDKFAYPLGKFPHEFAPPIDYDTLFNKTVSNQVNFYMDALGLPQLNSRLKVVLSLF